MHVFRFNLVHRIVKSHQVPIQHTLSPGDQDYLSKKKKKNPGDQDKANKLVKSNIVKEKQ
jgi:hypothetical protein